MHLKNKRFIRLSVAAARKAFARVPYRPEQRGEQQRHRARHAGDVRCESRQRPYKICLSGLFPQPEKGRRDEIVKQREARRV